MNSVGLTLVERSIEITRPTNTDAYAVNNVISNSTSAPTILTFNDCAARDEGGGYISKGRLYVDSATALLGMQVRLHLYHTAPTPINDNSPFTLLYANVGNRIGYIDFSALETGGAGSNAAVSFWTGVPILFRCPSGSKALYGIPIVKISGAAPASGQKLKFFLGIEQHP